MEVGWLVVGKGKEAPSQVASLAVPILRKEKGKNHSLPIRLLSFIKKNRLCFIRIRSGFAKKIDNIFAKNFVFQLMRQK